MSDFDFDLYQELIIDHGTQPRNHMILPNPTHTASGKNPICGDSLVLYLKINNNIIEQATFQGEGCAISTASASIMSEILKNKTIEQAEHLFQDFHQLLTSTKKSEQKLSSGALDEKQDLKLNALIGVKAYPMRIKCATLPWHALEHALHSDHSQATTEQ
jgi:nitrogen fixation protein NifU and related proteins